MRYCQLWQIVDIIVSVTKLVKYFKLHDLLVLKKLLSQIDSHKSVVNYIALCCFVYQLSVE